MNRNTYQWNCRTIQPILLMKFYDTCCRQCCINKSEAISIAKDLTYLASIRKLFRYQAHVWRSISAGRELDGDSRGYRSAEEQARELTRSIRREVNKLSEQWNALIERSDAWKRKLDDTANVSTLPSFYLHRKPLTLEPHYPIWIQIFWFRQKPLAATTIEEQLDSNHRWRCTLVSIKLPHNFAISLLSQRVFFSRKPSKFRIPVEWIMRGFLN